MKITKSRIAAYAFIPAFALTLVGASMASAHGMWGGWGANEATPEEIASRQTQMFQSQADLFGTDVNTVKEAWADGKTLREFAEEIGISQDDLNAKMAEQHKERMQEHLQTLVDAGVITEGQAKRRLSAMEQRTFERGVGFGGPRGHHGGRIGF